jgi:hypothetical protein
MLTHKVPHKMYPLGIAYQSKSSICIADIEVLTLHPNGRMCSAGRKFLQMSLASISSSNPVSCLLQNKWHTISLQVHCKPAKTLPKLSICSEICKTATCYDKCSPQQTQSNMNILYVTWKETTGRYDIQEMKMPESALLGKKPLPAAPKPIM